MVYKAVYSVNSEITINLSFIDYKFAISEWWFNTFTLLLIINAFPCM